MSSRRGEITMRELSELKEMVVELRRCRAYRIHDTALASLGRALDELATRKMRMAKCRYCRRYREVT